MYRLIMVKSYWMKKGSDREFISMTAYYTDKDIGELDLVSGDSYDELKCDMRSYNKGDLIPEEVLNFMDSEHVLNMDFPSFVIRKYSL